MTEAEAFDKFDDRLKLNPAERLRAEKCHNEITLLLKAAGLITGAFLQGSFARKTMIRPLRDIDKVVILADSLLGLSPDDVMDRLEDVLRVKYPKATFDRTRHSLKIDFGDDSFCFDVVPAWETTTNDDDVLIANRESGQWDRSNTRELMRVVAKRNEDCEGQFIHVVRMMKYLVAVGMEVEGTIPGLHVESIVYAGMQGPIPYAEACVSMIETAIRVLDGGYTDPTGCDPISNRLTVNARLNARSAFQVAAAKAREARALAEAGDHANSIRVWHDLFAEPFPNAKEQSLGAALASALGGSVTSTGHVSRTSAARQSAPPTRSWKSS
jgi:hypothetical protein